MVTNRSQKPAAKKADSEDEESDADSESESGSEEDSEEDSAEEESDEEPQPKKRKAEESVAAPAKKTKTDTNGESGEGVKNLFVGNLSWNVDEEWLTREFEEFGEITRVNIITDKQTGRSKG